MIETYVTNFHTSFFISDMQNILFCLPHIHIIGTNQCDNTRREAFNCRIKNQDVLYPRSYAEKGVSSFEHQIQSE